jgi:hypothetical protein
VPAGITTAADGKEIKPPEDLTPFNPMIPDKDGITLMRNTAKCPLPNETNVLQQHIQLLTNIQKMDDEVVPIIAKGLAVYMMVNTFCHANLKERIAVEFASDAKLTALHQEIKDRSAEMDELNRKAAACSKAAEKAINERWNHAVKEYGLNPAKNFYALNEDTGQIMHLQLDCPSCKGKASMRKARQAAGEYIQKTQAKMRPKGPRAVKTPAEEEKPPAKEKETR